MESQGRHRNVWALANLVELVQPRLRKWDLACVISLLGFRLEQAVTHHLTICPHL